MLEVEHLSVMYDDTQVLHDVTLTVQRGEIFCLLGPSGCGKTTLLRTIAGLEQAYTGVIRQDGQSIEHIPVHERGFGLMFQDFALFPHLNVRENIRFGLHMKKGGGQAERICEVLALTGLQDFEDRDVTQLSGGERQRVALARSLAPNPTLLMLDEPLGSLDAALRQRLMIDLRNIIKQVGLTAIYVTHDQQEAYAVADRVAVMTAGEIIQIDAPERLYREPASQEVARFLQLQNIVPVLQWLDGVADTPIGKFKVNRDVQAILIHPDEIEVGVRGDISVTVVECVFSGSVYRLVALSGGGVRLHWSMPSKNPKVPRIGDNVYLIVNHDAVVGLKR